MFKETPPEEPTARQQQIFQHAMNLFNTWQIAQNGQEGQIPKECIEYGLNVTKRISTGFTEIASAFDIKAGEQQLGFNLIARHHAMIGVGSLLGEMLWNNANYCYEQLKSITDKVEDEEKFNFTQQEELQCKTILFQLLQRNLAQLIEQNVLQIIKSHQTKEITQPHSIH